MSIPRKKPLERATFSVEFSDPKERKFEDLNLPPKVLTSLNEDREKVPLGYPAWQKDRPSPMDPSGHLMGKTRIHLL